MAAAKPPIVGAFVLGSLVLAVVAILFFGGTHLFAPKARAVVFFEGSVAGLDIGAPVTFRGVRVGAVQHMALHLSLGGQARIPVTLELLPGQVSIEGEGVPGGAGLDRMVAVGLRAQLVVQSFVTGQLRVDLDFLPDSPGRTVAADTEGLVQIPTMPSSLERLRATLSEVPVQDLAQSAQRVLSSVESVVARLEGELGPLLDGTRRGVTTATSTLEATERAVGRLQADASRTLLEFDQLVSNARQQLNDRGVDLARALGAVDRLARRTEAVMTSIDSLTTSRAQFRGDLEAAARDLAAGAASLRGFARAVERDPSALIRSGSVR